MSTIGIKFLYAFSLGNYKFDNPGGNISSVSPGSAVGHPPVNLTTTPLRETWRSGSDISNFQDIVIESDSTAEAQDLFAILNHNLSSLAVVQIQGSQTTSFTGAPTVSVPWSEKHMVLLASFGTPYRYYRFRFLDPSNECGFVEIGRIVAGKALTITENEDITDDIQIAQDDMAYTTNTEGFFRAFNKRIKIDRLSMRFSKLSTRPGQNVNYLGLLEMFKTAGKTFPFLTVVDPEDQDFEIIWGVFDNVPSRSFGINRYVDMPLSITEVY